jgi:hypothetical protein
MKRTAGLMCLGSLYAGALWIEYQTALLLGTGYFLFAAGSALTLLAAALYRAPEGHERCDGFTYGRGIADRAWFVTSDSRNRHVYDNEMKLRLSH